MATVIRATALRAGGACVRCRKGKTKCVYENGRAPCKNCAKGMHECYLPSESMSHGGHGVSPARAPQRSRESLPSEGRSVGGATGDRQVQPAAVVSRHAATANEKLTPELLTECERVISKTLPACVAFHKPSFLQQLKSTTMDPTMVNALLTTAARHSPVMIRRYGVHGGGGSAAAEHFAAKTINLVMQSLDHPSLADIQALCLLVIHEWGCRNAVRAYIYLGQAARMAQMYNIVQSHASSDPEQFLKQESFRRTLWLIYILDCFLTSSPGRHPALSSHDVNDVALPCQDMNYHFGSPVFVRTLSGTVPSVAPDPNMAPAEVGEFGHIVLATRAWRNVVEMMTTTSLETFSEEQCQILESDIDAIRQSLPMHFADKNGQINLHITMGSGFTYAMIHCLLHCATIFVNRRRILQLVNAESFNVEAWRVSAHTYMVDRIFTASHSIIAMLIALENGADKDSLLCFPIFMLFAAFTAGSTVAYLYLKGLAPPNATETASHIVRDSLRFMHDGAESWPLVMPWNRHLAVMAKVLRDVNSQGERSGSHDDVKPSVQDSPFIKDDVVSQPDTNPDVMDYDQPQGRTSQEPISQSEPRGSEPPAQRRTGITTINGGSVGTSTPANGSPPPANPMAKIDSPEPQSSSSTGGGPGANNAPNNTAGPNVEITAKELCNAFERQLLELDDLAAFMGGGVPPT